MLEGFKKFIFRGNVVDLAVAVIIGAAFSKIVDSLVKDILTPFIGLIVGTPNFSGIAIHAHEAVDKNGKVIYNEMGKPVLEGGIMIGNFLNELISFLLVSAAVYFFVVIPLTRLMALMVKKEEAAPAPPASKEELLLTEIRDLLKTK